MRCIKSRNVFCCMFSASPNLMPHKFCLMPGAVTLVLAQLLFRLLVLVQVPVQFACVDCVRGPTRGHSGPGWHKLFVYAPELHFYVPTTHTPTHTQQATPYYTIHYTLYYTAQHHQVYELTSTNGTIKIHRFRF